MNKTRLILITFLLVIFSTAVFAQSKNIKVGTIDNTNGEYDNCGVSLTFAGSPSGMDEFIGADHVSWMKIDGKIVELKPLKSSEDFAGEVKKGDKFSETFSAKGLKVVVNYTVTGFEEDTTKYKASVVITKGKNKRTVNLVGWGGC